VTQTQPLHAYSPLASVIRSGFTESVHYGSIIALDRKGHTVLSLGPVEDAVLPRSTVKPVQALSCLEAGADLDAEELAIAAGSHTGEDAHLRVVGNILRRAGLDESALQCPSDRPEDEATYEDMIRRGEPRRPLRMNCSGKHAAMLLACSANGWSTENYLDPEHPLQRRIRTTMEDTTGVQASNEATDGCGAPLFSTTIRGLATAFRTLVLADPATPQGRISAAMRQNPFYVGGTGHQNSTLMENMPGVLAKGGAEGVIAVAAPDGSAVSMKVIDGSPRATTLLAIHVLGLLGHDTHGARSLSEVAVLGGGHSVGTIKPSPAIGKAIRLAL
jgi:L-asparaginase II